MVCEAFEPNSLAKFVVDCMIFVLSLSKRLSANTSKLLSEFLTSDCQSFSIVGKVLSIANLAS